MGSWFFIIALVLVLLVALTAGWASLRAAPFVPTRARDVKRILDLAAVKSGELVVDLGAGDGRFLILAVKQFRARAAGYEISFLPFIIGQLRIWLSGVRSSAKLWWRDLFNADLRQADVVVFFLMPGAIDRLRLKMERELRPGARVVSYVFPITGWTPIVKDKPSNRELAVWVYQR